MFLCQFQSFLLKHVPKEDTLLVQQQPTCSGTFILVQIKLLQGRWCLIAFTHLALEGRSLEKEEEKGRDKTGMEGWRKPSRLLHPWREKQKSRSALLGVETSPPPQPPSLPSLFSHHPSFSPCSSHPLPLSFLFLFFCPQDVYTFLPSTCLAAGYE